MLLCNGLRSRRLLGHVLGMRVLDHGLFAWHLKDSTPHIAMVRRTFHLAYHLVASLVFVVALADDYIVGASVETP